MKGEVSWRIRFFFLHVDRKVLHSIYRLKSFSGRKNDKDSFIHSYIDKFKIAVIHGNCKSQSEDAANRYRKQFGPEIKNKSIRSKAPTKAVAKSAHLKKALKILKDLCCFCAGRGRCVGGQCQCDPGYRHSKAKIKGDYCQCDECPKRASLICSGNGR